jgi:hypothetical protein
MAALGATTVAAGVLAAGTMSADAATPRPSSNSTQSSPSIQQITDSTAGVTNSYPDNDTAAGHAVSPDHPWTINYRDSTGQVTRVWHGTRAAATALGQQWKAGRGTVAPAPSIIKTNSCRDLLRLRWLAEPAHHRGVRGRLRQQRGLLPDRQPRSLAVQIHQRFLVDRPDRQLHSHQLSALN